MRAPVITFKRARAMRRDMSLPEVILWDCLRKGHLEGLQFRRQHPIGPWILDFYCPKAMVAVEVDGAEHDMPAQILHDERRDAWLSQRGIRVLRFAASEILKDDELEGVLSAILEAAAAPSTAFGGPPPPLRG